MRIESRLISWRCQSAASWTKQRPRQKGGGQGGVNEKFRIRRVWESEHGSNARRSSDSSVIFHSGVTLKYLSVAVSSPPTLTCLQCCLTQSSVLYSISRCSSMQRSYRASASVCPPTPAFRDQPRSCQVMLAVALPLPSLSSSLSCLLIFPSSSKDAFFPYMCLVCFGVGGVVFFFLFASRRAQPASSLLCFLSPPLNICSLTDCDGRSVYVHNFIQEGKRRGIIDACRKAVRKKKKEPYHPSNLSALLLYFPQ